LQVDVLAKVIYFKPGRQYQATARYEKVAQLCKFAGREILRSKST
jgi:hypothetical protein